MMEESQRGMAPVLVLGANPAWQKTVTCDRLKPGEVARVRLQATGAAGKGFNTARVVRAFGVPVVLVSATGPDAAEWEAACREDGMRTESFAIEGAIRTATTVRDLATGLVTEIVEEGPSASSGALETMLSHLDRESARAAMVVVAGTFPPGLDCRSVVEFLAGLPVPVVLDSIPAIRALVELDRAPMDLLVKLNESEWNSVFRCEGLDDALAIAHRKWPQASLLATRGDQGAVLVHADGQCRILTAPPFGPDVEINPIGAGDAFTGGVAVALRRGEGILSAALHGMSVARASCLNPLPGRFSMKDVEVSREQVRALVPHA